MSRANARSSGIPDEVGSAWHRVAAVAARQYGLITTRRLRELGVARSTISDAVAAGRLYRVHRAVYSVGAAPRGIEARWMAAVLAAGPGGALSHRSSGELQRFLRIDELALARSPIHVASAGAGSRRDGLIVHSARLEAVDLTTHRGIPTTTAARAIFDLTPSLSPREIARAVGDARYLGIVDERRLRELCAGGRGHRNVAALRELLVEAPAPLLETRSRLEALLLEICSDHGLPLPAVNVPLLGYEVDFLWPREGFVVEVDGAHHTGRRRDADNRRDLRLGRAGYLLRRYSAADLAKPARVALEVGSILAERSRHGP